MTEAEINRECAVLCGYQDVADDRDREEYGQDHEFWESSSGEAIGDIADLPNFCKDRNALPALLQEVINQNCEYEFEDAMKNALCGGGTILDTLDALMADPRLVAEAVLRATSRWKE